MKGSQPHALVPFDRHCISLFVCSKASPGAPRIEGHNMSAADVTPVQKVGCRVLSVSTNFPKYRRICRSDLLTRNQRVCAGLCSSTSLKQLYRIKLQVIQDAFSIFQFESKRPLKSLFRESRRTRPVQVLTWRCSLQCNRLHIFYNLADCAAALNSQIKWQNTKYSKAATVSSLTDALERHPSNVQPCVLHTLPIHCWDIPV